MTPGRRPRAGERGQTIPFVAVGFLAMIAVTGLALDGGHAVASYRQSQDASDAGAMAAARLVYTTHGAATTSQLCDATTGAGPVQVTRNAAQLVSCHPMTLAGYVPSASGFTASSSLFYTDLDQSLVVGDLKSHLGFNETTGSVTSGATPTASGSVDLAGLSANLTLLSSAVLSGSSTAFSCSTSNSTAGTTVTQPPNNGNCSNSALALSLTSGLVNVNVVSTDQITNVGVPWLQQSSSTVPPNGGIPTQYSTSQVSAATVSAGLNHTVQLSGGSMLATSSTLVGSPDGFPGARASSNIANANFSLANGALTLGISAGTVQAAIRWVPGRGFVNQNTCNFVDAAGNSTVTYGGTSGTGTITVNADCSVSIPSFSNASVLSIGSVDTSPTCTAGAGGSYTCSTTVCLIQVKLSVAGLSSATVCIGSASASGTFTPVNRLGAVEVTSQIPTSTYFLRVLGITSTSPTTTSGAMPEQVIGESKAMYQLAPYAITDLRTPSSGAGCPTTRGPLLAGCTYTLYGPSIPAADDNAGADSLCGGGWKGYLSTSATPPQAADLVDSLSGVAPTFACANASGPAPNAGKYVLLPVIDSSTTSTATQSIRGYAIFLLTDGTHGTLVAQPAMGGSAPPVDVQSMRGWDPTWIGAVAIKLVDTSFLTSAGYTAS